MAIRYPNGKKVDFLNQLSSNVNYGNRGMTLEDDLNLTNAFYREQGICLVHKKPTPVQIVNVDYPKRSAAKITEAYFKKPSTTDYNGVYRGHYIDFEAKETKNKTSLPLQNFHEHQVTHMEQVKAHQGISFIIVKFADDQSPYLLDADLVIAFWKDQQKGGRKSIPKKMIVTNGQPISIGLNPRLDYIKAIDRLYF
ncbi:Holliday junction resolvase RecU [Pullulanibacillus sp. KACC 23026]|uniref:Holliday junction resolvase RecU n=1 Tax=Pullulanibacillus sp. KACC 23026 TaxID=3028315 RepID=UPI0023B0E45F|nr:Holliday junction resolvase RecU [Pullulanibacillus sp. KACC 23026]WEG11324.1 Holliday junction resolvase RecU [Pullulanibacillus sp. KACC 23026]